MSALLAEFGAEIATAAGVALTGTALAWRVGRAGRGPLAQVVCLAAVVLTLAVGVITTWRGIEQTVYVASVSEATPALVETAIALSWAATGVAAALAVVPGALSVALWWRHREAA